MLVDLSLVVLISRATAKEWYTIPELLQIVQEERPMLSESKLTRTLDEMHRNGVIEKRPRVREGSLIGRAPFEWGG